MSLTIVNLVSLAPPFLLTELVEADATEATAFLDFTVVSGRIHYTPPTPPGHFVARTKPYHYTGEEQ